MATKRTSARSRTRPQPKASRRTKQSAVRRLLPPLLWLARFARPRSGSEALTLLLSILTFVTTLAGATRLVTDGHVPGIQAIWCAALLIAALVAHTASWWRQQLVDMTQERARYCVAGALLALVAISFSSHFVSTNLSLGGDYLLLGPWSRPPAATVCLISLALLAAAIVLNPPIAMWISAVTGRIREIASISRERRVLAVADVHSLPVYLPEPSSARVETSAATENPKPPETQPTGVKASAPVTSPPAEKEPALPRIDLLVPAPKASSSPMDLELKAQRIQETLASFNVEARVVGHHCGPVVTQFDIQPARGVKVRRITELHNDLALALAAPTIRIQAPVPGKPVVGIEIPNSSTTMVTLRELLESDAYLTADAALKVALGKDVLGVSKVIDLAKMPHLLIAGATGSGKSAFVNSLIGCLLYQNTPERLRILMVDPKVVELGVYNGIPHLLSPVVTQMDKVVGVLQWSLREMERRYQLFADATVRNIQRYNEKMETNGLKRLPYMVIIIDELADLMMVAPEDVEDAICRLAQLARAAGIHLVIATQRPSVDVVTGLIKANFPARIAFAMTSQVDSRTILDSAGAEKLLGRGDMLYMPPDAAQSVRLQGAYLSDQEIERMVEFWQRSPLQTAVQRIAEEEFAAAEKEAAESEDELFGEAVRIVREYQHASVSLLQRRLKIGYARASRLMDQLEARHIVGQADGSKQRPVLDEGSADSA